MGFEFDAGIGKQKTGFIIDRYRVDRLGKEIFIEFHYCFDDGSIEESSHYILDNAFDSFYPTFSTDAALYNYLAEALGFTGSINLENEPQ